jgi:hypothetical protein
MKKNSKIKKGLSGKTNKAVSKKSPKKAQLNDFGSILKMYSIGPAEGILIATDTLTGWSSSSGCGACSCGGTGYTC